MAGKIPPPKVGRKLGVRHTEFRPKPVQMLPKDRDCLQTERFSLSVEAVREQLQSYDLPDSDSEGVGLVIIPENLNRRKGYVSTYIVFFDLDTRDVLKGAHIWAKHKHGKLMRSYFGSALIRCIKRYHKVV
jgi:hypothetical protein